MRRFNGQKRSQVSALAVAIHLGFAATAWGATPLPQGATVVNGQALITKPSESSLHIQASGGSIINWQQFSIGSNGQVRFTLPGASSAVLNRVIGADASQLLGALQSNGRVFLINPNGIVVGAGARIDANSFIGSTLDMADGDFLAGKLRFLGASGAGAIRNDGVISAGPGGRIALIAPDIQNTGIIQAPGGQILLAAGRKLEISSLDFEGVSFEIQAPTDSVLNLGKLLAENGAVSAFAGTLRHSGEIRASGMVLDSDGSIRLVGSNTVHLTSGSVTSADGLGQGGSITVQSAGTSRVAGSLSALGADGTGGQIAVLGARVALEAGARLDASGASGGGQILVGGDFQGKNAAVQNASRVYVDADARLQADAIQSGDGGKVVVWADENTRYYGSLSARGGAASGNGGQAEVSGKQNLVFAGSADLGASAGHSGNLLLDPLDILVSNTGGVLPSVLDQFSDFSGNVVTLSPTAMNNIKGDVTLQAERDIYFNDSVALTTSGAALSATAGGSSFDAATGGHIYLNQPISTTGGAVTLRAVGVSGTGTISTQGGAVDIKTSGGTGYTAAISSAGGAVSLVSQTGSVSLGDVDAGSGSITVGTTTGSIGGGNLTAGTVNLAATEGSVSNVHVNASTQVNASSSNASVFLYNLNSQPLRLGTLTAASDLYLSSDGGMSQAAGGVLTAPRVTLQTQGSSTSAGSAAAPLSIATPRLVVSDVSAPVFVAFSGNPTLDELRLNGNLAGLSASSLGGAANLASLSLGSTGSALTVSADSGATSGLGSGFVLSVSDAGINASNLNLTGANVTLTSATTLDIGTLNATSLYGYAKGAVTLGTVAVASGGSGIHISTQSCLTSYTGCSASSPITATSLSAGSAPVNLSTYDNGDITVSGSLTAGSATLTAGNSYATTSAYPYYTMRTVNSITVASASTSGGFTLTNRGSGSVNLGSLAATGSVSLNAGGSTLVSDPSFPLGKTVYTTNSLAVTVAEPAAATGSFQINNSGVGNVSLAGAVSRPSGSVSVSASNGSVSATGDLSASSSVTVSAGSNALALANVTASSGSVNLTAGSTLTVGQVSAGSVTSTSNYATSLNAGGDLSFQSISSNALPSYAQSNGYGSVTLSSTGGAIKPRQDNAAADISSNGNVTLNASSATLGVIGDSTFAHPLDIVSGTAASNSVTLSAGKNVGAVGKALHVDTNGVLSVASSAGQFFVAAQSMDGLSARSLSGIKLSASAAGLGNGGTSTLSSQDLSVNASSDGSSITIGNIVQSVNALNQFSFTTTGGGLNFGNINLATTGTNQVLLTSVGALAQTAPVTTNNISGGYVKLDAGSSALTVGHVTSSTAGANSVGNLVELSGGTMSTGDLSGPGVKVTGTALNLGSVTSTGTNRGYYGYYLFVPRLGTYQYVTDELRLTATGALSTSGPISSATSAFVIGAGVTVGGTGSITGGHTDTYYYADKIDVQSGTGTATVGTLNAYDVTVTGANINTGAVTANRTLNLGGASTVALSSGAVTNTGTVTYGSPSVTLNAGSLTTGNVSTTGAINVTANATGSQVYAPGISLSSGLTSGSVTVTAANGIDLSNSGVTSPNVTLNSSAGNINASLTGAKTLTLATGGKFNVNSSTPLNSVTVTADGVAAGAGVSAGAGSSISDGGNSVLLSLVDTVPNVAGAVTLTLSPSSGSTAYRYTESNSAVTALTLSTNGTLASGSSISVTTPAAQISTPTIAMTNGSLTLNTGGEVNLTSVTTGGGSVNVLSNSGSVNLTSVSTQGGSVVARTSGDATKNVNVVSVNTLGGGVSLTADNGSITGTAAQAIDMRNAAGGASGTLTLVAEQGSIGSAASPLLTSGAVTLDARAKNAIEVSVANTALSNLYLSTSASGSGAVNVVNRNFANLALTRSGGTELDLSGLNPTTAGVFSLTARDGNINVKSDIGNVSSLTLNATLGDVTITGGAGAARSVSSNGTMNLQAGRDVLVASGAQATESLVVQSNSTMTVSAGRDIRVKGDGASVLLKQATAFNAQNLSAGRDISVTGGGTANASATVLSFNGYQTLNATGNLLVQGGTASGAFASVQTGSTGQSQTVYANHFSVLGGADGAYASVRGGSQSLERIYGNALLQGGSGSGAYAEVASTSSSQSFGNQSTYYYSNVTDSISILGGTGAGAYASLRSAASQEVHSAGDINVVAGSGAAADAEIKATTSQNLGGTNTYYYSSTNTATGNVLVQASAAGLARIQAGGSQTVLGGGTVSVLGGSAAGMTAAIETTAGSQTVGSSSTSNNVATAGIVVQGGSGAGAWIKASGSQTLMTGGNIDVLGGTGSNTTASIESTGGSQNIGYTYQFSNDALGNISVKGGSGSGSAAWIKAASGQTLDAGGIITVSGGASGAYADIVSTAGTQTLGNRNSSSYDATDSVVLTGGSGSGAYARVAALGGSQTVQAASAITLGGGSADGSGALLLAATGQTVASSGTLAITGGTASSTLGNESGVRNTSSGTQSVQASTSIALTGGGAGSDTWIKQAGTGAQSISSAGTLALTAPTVGANKVSIESGAGGQTLSAQGALSLDNAGANSVHISSGGKQTLSAASLSVLLASTTGTAPQAAVTAAGDQFVTLHGIAAPVAPIDTPAQGTAAAPATAATLTLANLSGAAGSLALLQAGGSQTLSMDYLRAGLMKVGASAAQGASKVYATGDQTVVVGELLLQGGATAAARATLSAGTVSSGTMLLSTLGGPIRVTGGAAGPADIDPLTLGAVSNGSILITSGSGSTAGASVLAGTINMTATNGNMAVIGGGAPATVVAATAATVAGANTFNLNNSGGLTISGGSITASAGGTVSLGGFCTGCGLVGPFTLTEVKPVTSASYTPNLLVSTMLALLDQATLDLIAAGYDLVVAEDGTVTSRRRNLNQCY